VDQTSILSCLQEESGKSTNTSDETANVERRSSAGELRGRAGLGVATSLGGVASASRDGRLNTSAGGNGVRSASGVGSNGDRRAVGGSLNGLGGGLLSLGGLGGDNSGGVSGDAQDGRRRDDVGGVLVNNGGGLGADKGSLLNDLGGGDLSDC
jgi:hypothetical protein